MIVRWFTVSLLALSITAVSGFAQTVVPRFETLDVESGLSQNSVYSLYQDKRGFMWFGTADGLNRYDGEHVRAFKIKGPPLSLASNTVRASLCEDKSGRIWYVNETGIYDFNPVKEEVEQALDFVKLNKGLLIYYSCISLDEEENLWLISPVEGVVQFSTLTKKVTLHKFPEEMRKEGATYTSSSGSHLFLHFPSHPGILQFSTITKTFAWIPGKHPAKMGSSGNGHLFRIEDGQVSILDTANRLLRSVPLKADTRFFHVQEDAFGRTWAATLGNGLHVYLSDQHRDVTFRHDVSVPKSLPSDIITALYIDATDNLWIATDGGGVARLNLKPPLFNAYPLSPGVYPALKNNFTRCFFEDKSGRIWFGTLDNGIGILDPRSGELSSHGPDKGLVSVGAIFQDRDDQVWVGHGKSMSIFKPTKNQFAQVTNDLVQDPKLNSNDFYTIIQLKDGDLLAGTFNGVYQIRKLVEGGYQFSLWKKFTMTITALHEAADGHVWVATRVNGLYDIAPSDTNAYYSQKYLNGIDLRSAHQDELDPGMLWLCSRSGLLRFNLKTHDAKLYNEDNGIPGGVVYGILEDDHHNFWFSTNQGLCFLDRKTEAMRNFTVNDGLQSNEFNTGAFYKGASGTLYFGGIKGFNWFKTGAERPDLSPPRAGITGVRVNDLQMKKDSSSFFYSGQFNLPYDQNDLSFEFAAFDYTRPEANKIRYRLEGWDKQWVIANVKSTRYSNLPPGHYVLHLQASVGGDSWGAEDTIAFAIKAPFWETRPFYGAMIVLLVSAVIGTTRAVARRKINRKLQVLEKERVVLKERERISKDIHDDLGSGLSKISILSELAQQSGGADEFTQRQLEKISASSHELIDNMSDLIWSNNPNNDSFLKLLAHMREHLATSFDGTPIKFDLQFPMVAQDKPLNSDWRRNIFLVAKEAVHNIAKHAKATRATLEIACDDSRLIMQITDNGQGFVPEEKTNMGYGLGNMRQRIENCSGSLLIESSPGKGTRLHAEVPFPA